MALMLAPLPLTDEISVKQQLLTMGFESNHIDEAIKSFKLSYGNDYNINTILELTMQIKHKQTQITQQISKHNKQTIGTELYYKIHSFEPILAGKITGMMLQWNTNKLIKLLNRPSELQQLINTAKAALNNVPFTAHMDSVTAQNLRAWDKIDFRNTHGKFMHSTVLHKKNTQLLVHMDELPSLFDTWCDYTTDLQQFAVSGSISARPAHRLQQLSVGDMVDFKPTLFGQWTCGKVTNVDCNSGQVEVMYECQSRNCAEWTHTDNSQQISVFRTKYEYVDISMDLLNWKALTANPYSKDTHGNIKKLMSLNNNEIIAVSDYNIYKYFITSNKWIVWRTHDFQIVTCCLNEDKNILYILSQKIACNFYITQLDVLTSESVKYYVFFPHLPDVMLLVENMFHFFAIVVEQNKEIGMHFIWNKEMKQEAQLAHCLNNLTPKTQHLYSNRNTAFIHCRHRNILLLFGRYFGDQLYVHSLKQNKWFSIKYKNDPLSLDYMFGFALTNDEKYVLIFPGSPLSNSSNICSSAGKILLLDISNYKLIYFDSVNILLSNAVERAEYPMPLKEYPFFYPLIINKTTILIDAFLRQCWESNAFKGVRLLSDDVICLIQGWYGYDNDELYIYCVCGGYLWNTKVNQIIKHQLPKLKFCADQTILKQEQEKIMILKNKLLQKHNELTAQIQRQHRQQQAIYGQHRQQKTHFQIWQEYAQKTNW